MVISLSDVERQLADDIRYNTVIGIDLTKLTTRQRNALENWIYRAFGRLRSKDFNKPMGIMDFTVEQQLVIAEQVLAMLNSSVHKDETTDPTGFNIDKGRVAEISASILGKIKRGALQPSKIVGGFNVD